MIIKNCTVCGKEFEARQSNFVYCSAECRRIGRNKVHSVYVDKNKYKIRQRCRDRCREKAKQNLPPCRICGNPVPKEWTGTRYSQRFYHLECIVDQVRSLLDKRGTDEYRIAMKLADNHGISKKDILEGLYD